MIEIYIKQPVAVEAIQFTGNNFDDIYELLGADNINIEWYNNIYLHIVSKSLAGSFVFVKRGEYIVKDMNGNFYAYDPIMFNKTFYKMSFNDVIANIKEDITKNFTDVVKEDSK
jgi:hypothetical protein